MDRSSTSAIMVAVSLQAPLTAVVGAGASARCPARAVPDPLVCTLLTSGSCTHAHIPRPEQESGHNVIMMGGTQQDPFGGSQRPVRSTSTSRPRTSTCLTLPPSLPTTMRWSEAFAATFQDPQDVLDSLPRSRKPMFTFPEEVARVRVPVPPPPPRETLDPRKGPITSVQFTDDGRGISMGELLTCSQDYVRAKMGSAFHRPCPVNFWINIHWPVYWQFCTPRTLIRYRGNVPNTVLTTRYDVAVQIAEAYRYYMSKAATWHWDGSDEESPWRISYPGSSFPRTSQEEWDASVLNLRTMHLVSIQRLDDADSPKYMAEVHEVLQPVELPDMFWECFELAK
ncbi:hypothetical protein OH76DRAFT_1412727 [Lentinus brumalis]|uniref:Uncharacterized protein n=1 Tax=Lentinus brumalis TaxID=2498619 RepID=A0A371CKC2_9APHY|nr:hypothetical protein OH76DRAFT_1412727 [Polyporus brumalis]